MSAISGSSRSSGFLTRSVEAARSASGHSTRRLPPPPLPSTQPASSQDTPRTPTRRLPPPPLPHRPSSGSRREEESDVPFLDCAPGTHPKELARFTPQPGPPPIPLPAPPPEPEPAAARSNSRRVRKSDPAWRGALTLHGLACRVCGSTLDPGGPAGCRRCGEAAPRLGETPESGSSGFGDPLPDGPPARRLMIMGALACAAVGLPVTLFLEGEARFAALALDLLLGALAGPWARRGAGLPAFTLAGAVGGASKVAAGTLLASAALSWDALQTDPLLLGLLAATLFATTILGGLLSLSSAPFDREALAG